MRLVLDTNIGLSALLWGGKPKMLLRKAKAGSLQLFASSPLMSELEVVLNRPGFDGMVRRSGLSRAELLNSYRKMTEIVQPAIIPRTSIDPDDDMVLGTGKTAGADLIISGDRHLLTIGKFEGISIVKVLDALKRAGIVL